MTPSLDEIRSLLGELPPPRPEPQPPAALDEGTGALGAWLAGAQGRTTPSVERPRVALFAAAGGAADVALDGRTRARIDALVAEADPVVEACRDCDADLRVYEMSLDTETGPFDAVEAARAVAYGMMAIEPGLDVLGVAAIGAEEAAFSLVAALRDDPEADPLAALVEAGRADIAAIVGAILAARLAAVPILLDGAAAHAAALVVTGLRGDLALHCRGIEADEGPSGLAAAEAICAVREVAERWAEVAAPRLQ